MTIFGSVLRRRFTAIAGAEVTELVTIQLDWKTARMVAGACIVAAELEDTDGNDANVLQLASAIIMRSVNEDHPDGGC